MIYKTVSLTESQVGKYVDINGDGIPEGVIFADLAVGGKCLYGEGIYGEYKIPTIKEGLKDYIVIDGFEDKINGKQEVLAPILDGQDRFYIMALNNVNSDAFTWYESATYEQIKDYYTITSSKFGTGKLNTLSMLIKWNNSEYGKKKQNDLWNKIKIQVQNGWFIPSKEEFSCFGTSLGLTKLNFLDKGLNPYYWTSSLNNTSSAFHISLIQECMKPFHICNFSHVRLAATI